MEEVVERGDVGGEAEFDYVSVKLLCLVEVGGGFEERGEGEGVGEEGALEHVGVEGE